MKAGAVSNTPDKVPLITVNGFSKHFKDIEALRDVGFSIFDNEIVGVIGPNGAGKTTLLECLCGLQPLQAGDVLWKGERLPPHRYRKIMFYVPDGITPYGEHTAGSVLGFFGDAFGRSRQQVWEIVELLDLEPVLSRTVGRLSKGWRRRLLLAIGLVSPHPLLIMDEPFDGLDLHQTRAVMRILRDAAAGRSLLLSIHQLPDAERVCDRFVLLTAGRVAGSGTLDALRRQIGKERCSLEEIFFELS